MSLSYYPDTMDEADIEEYESLRREEEAREDFGVEEDAEPIEPDYPELDDSADWETWIHEYDE